MIDPEIREAVARKEAEETGLLLGLTAEENKELTRLGKTKLKDLTEAKYSRYHELINKVLQALQ